MSELAATESITAIPALPAVVPAHRAGLLQGILFAILGVVVMYIGLVPMGHVVGIVKVPVVLVSVAFLYLACDRVGKAIRGQLFDTGFWLSLTWLILLVAAAITAALLPLGEYRNASKTIGTPGNLRPDLLSSHPLGTNNISLDLLSRSIYAARVSLGTALFAVVVSIVIGVTIGMLAGYFRGWLDAVVGLLTDTSLAVPALVLLIAIAAVLGVPKSVPEAIVKEGAALAIVGIPTVIRLARANTLALSQREFVLASRALGANNRRILVKHLLPNVMLPIISYAFIIIAVLIVAEGSLAFLGLGLQQPQPTWGNMIAEGTLTVLRTTPHIPLVPGIFMFLTVYSFNRVGERIRRLWDPREATI
jgi:peptide/nickel transport system permease protein